MRGLLAKVGIGIVKGATSTALAHRRVTHMHVVPEIGGFVPVGWHCIRVCCASHEQMITTFYSISPSQSGSQCANERYAVLRFISAHSLC